MEHLQARYELLRRDLDCLEGWVAAAQSHLHSEVRALRSRHTALEARVRACGYFTGARAPDPELEHRLGDLAADAKRVWHRLTRGS